MQKILLVICILGMLHLQAQDGHYWSQQFGAYNNLTGGAFMAGNSDNSSIYYNPGGMAFLNSTSISLSANALQYQVFKGENTAGPGRNLSFSNFLFFPQLVAGSIPIVKSKKWHFSYGILTKHKNEIRTAIYDEYQADLLQGFSGNEEFIGSLEWEQLALEQWGAIGVGFKINDQIGIGLTNFIAFRKFDYKFIIDRRLFTNEANLVGSSFFNTTEKVFLTNFTYIPKIGVSIRKKNLNIGVTFTIPGIEITGKGDIEREFSVANIPVETNEGQTFTDGQAIDKQEDLAVIFKYPGSISLGIEYKFQKLKLGLTAEYFLNIEPYIAIQAREEKVIRPSSLDIEIEQRQFLSAVAESRGITNIALGLDYALKPSFSLLMGIYTDHAALGGNLEDTFASENLFGSPIFLARNNLDYYHFAAGVQSKRKKGQFSIGLTYSFGNKDFNRSITNFEEPVVENFLEGDTNIPSNLKYKRIGLAVGYDVIFK